MIEMLRINISIFLEGEENYTVLKGGIPEKFPLGKKLEATWNFSLIIIL